MNKKNLLLTIINITIIVIICIILLLDWFNTQELKKYASQQESIQLKEYKELIETNKLHLSTDYSFDLLEGMSEDVKTILTTDEILKKASFSSGYNGTASVTLSSKRSANIATQHSYLNMVVFVAYTEEDAAKIEFEADATSTTYSITKTPSAFYLPIQNYNNFSISLVSEFQPTHIMNIAVIQCPSDYEGMKCGQYELSTVDEFLFEDMTVVSEKACNQVLTKGDFIYAFYNGTLVIYEDTDTGYNQISTLDKPGSCTQMEFMNDDVLVVTSRENDVFFIDVSDVDNPQILSTYDAMDLACGLATSENYVFICSRYYGVEIIDVTDPSAPQLCSIINTGNECIDCCINGNYLYISNWNAQKVSVYNIENPNEPTFLRELEVDGNPYGIKSDGKSLFVATGHHARGLRAAKTDGAYGGGHGMEIYNIENPGSPIWNSTVKIDGRLYYPQVDSWNIYLNSNYAFLSSTYGGVYIFDVTNTRNPIRVGKITIKLKESDSKYNYEDNSKYIFPYDFNEYIIDPVSSIAFAENMCYLSCNKGLLSLSLDYVTKENAQQNMTALKEFDGSYFNSFNSVDIWDAKTYLYNNRNYINAVDIYENNIIIACGDKGLEVLSDEYVLKNNVKTAGPAQDVLVHNNIVFVAEGNYGIESYSIDAEGRMSLLDSYECDLFKETITHLQITSSGKYLIVQDGMAKLKILDVSSPDKMVLLKSAATGIGNLYRRNLIVSNKPSDIIGVGTSNRIILYSDKGGSLEQVGVIHNSIYGEHNGICYVDGNFYGICKNGYVRFTESDVANNQNLQLLSAYKCDQVFLSGKVSTDGKYMVVCNAVDRTITILNVEDYTVPMLIAKFSVDGNPEIAKIVGDKIYIPLRAQGLLILDFND